MTAGGARLRGAGAFPGTLVFYMGVKAPAADRRAPDRGRPRPPTEPAAVIERGTLPGQRTVSAPLAELPGAAAEAEIRAPAITVVGPVAARRETIAWLERRPLHGVRVVVTRARAAGERALAGAWRALGAEAVELPAIRIEPRIDTDEVRRAVEGIHAYALVCLTSAERRRGCCSRRWPSRAATPAPWPTPPSPRSAPAPRAALAEHGVIADVVPERFVAEALVEALAEVDVEGKPVLVARAAEARDVLPDALRERGAEVDVVALYETVARAARARGRRGGPATPTTSPSPRPRPSATWSRRSASEPAQRRPGRLDRPGHQRGRREAGLEVHVEAERHDIDGLSRRCSPTRRAADEAIQRRSTREGHAVTEGIGGSRLQASQAPRRLSSRAPSQRWPPPLDGPVAEPLPITFLSDYGDEDEFAGVCRAVIAQIAPEAPLIDLTHGIGRQRCRQGALALANALPFCPPGVHLAVVDPGVGADRRPVAVTTMEEGRFLVGPDNGLLAPAIERLGGAARAVDLANSPFRLEPVSATFHGRDLFAPVAAHLALGAQARRGRRDDRARRADRARAAQPQRRRPGASSPTRSTRTASATSRSTSDRRAAADGLAARRRPRRGARARRPLRGALGTHLRRRRRRATLLLYEDSSRAPGAGGQRRQRRGPARPRARTTRSSCAR